MKKLWILFSLILLVLLSACAQSEPVLTETTEPTTIITEPIETTIPSEPIETVIPTETLIDEEYEFIQNLMSTLTLEEKVGQMLQAEKGYITPLEVTQYNIGSILSGGGSHPEAYDDSPDDWYQMVRTYQEAALNSSSEIPLIYGVDAVHGHNNVYGATIFPHNINLGMTRNEDLIRQIGMATAAEVKSTGIHWNFSPAVSVTQDIRWGRTYESFSEDPSIHHMFISAYIEGLQAYDVIATAKHFVADGGTTNGIDQGDVIATEAEIRELHLPPYIDAIEAGVESIMISFSSINGLKMHGNDYWITDILKEELGFEGIIVSDWNATFQLPGDFRTQLATAINAGIDVLMLPSDWKNAHQEIIAAVQTEMILESRIDEAVTRILTVKYRNNLFTNPYDQLDSLTHFGTYEHKLLARQAASESFVLLKNNQALPLTSSENIFVTGPASDHVGYLAGGWTTYWQGNTNCDIGTGVSIKRAFDNYLLDYQKATESSLNDADTVVVVFTEVPYAEGAGDTSNPSIFGDKAHPDNELAYQQALSAKAAGKKVIGVLASGRPLLLGDTLDTFDAFIAIFLPGSEGGSALVNSLYGITPFTGQLSFTWPASLSYFTIGKTESTVLFPIGYGLKLD